MSAPNKPLHEWTLAQLRAATPTEVMDAIMHEDDDEGLQDFRDVPPSPIPSPSDGGLKDSGKQL